jgi:predicted nucleotidyltransferase
MNDVPIHWANPLANPLDMPISAMKADMAALATLDPVLRDFRDALAALYGPTLDRVVLFGSRALGDAKPASDHDVAVFLTEMENPLAEWDRITDLRVRFMGEGVFIDAIPFRVSDYMKRTPLMHEIRRDGLTL